MNEDRKVKRPETVPQATRPARGSACMADGCECPGYEDVHDSSSYRPGICARCGHVGSYHLVPETDA